MMDRKELKEAYRHIKPDMGVYAYKCKSTGKAYIGYGQNIKADVNSITFRLNFGSLNSKSSLQSEWTKHGEANFEIEVLEKLDYDKDETKTDYTLDLRTLRDCCCEKLNDFEFINN